MLGSRASAEPGPWRTNRMPYLRDVMDALSAVHPAMRVVFMKGAQVGASHGLGYILRRAKGVPHGITSCLMLHAVMRWNAPVNGPRQAQVARNFCAEAAGPAIEAFVRGLGLPTRLSEQGITPAEFAGLAARWNGDAPIATNPRAVRGAADLLEILQLAA